MPAAAARPIRRFGGIVPPQPNFLLCRRGQVLKYDIPDAECALDDPQNVVL
jgi:hypothetical protein